MDNKNDKQLVWDAIKEIESFTSNPLQNFALLNENIWAKLPISDRLRIRSILLSNGLIQTLGNNQWAFQLTTKGMLIKDRDIKKDGNLKKKYNKELIRNIIIATISALLGLVTATIQSKYLSERQPTKIDFPKIQIVHDTIFRNIH